MSNNKNTLKELILGTKSIMGHELNQVVEAVLNDGDDGSLEYEVAEQLWNDYFRDGEGIYKPAKFAYYTLELRGEDAYVCKRDEEMSPRAADFFVSDGSGSQEYNPEYDTLRTVIANKRNILGRDLKTLVTATLNHNTTEETTAFENFAIQLAEYAQQFYLNDGNVKDDVWYHIRTREYGTLILLRNHDLSPRTITEKKSGKKRK